MNSVHKIIKENGINYFHCVTKKISSLTIWINTNKMEMRKLNRGAGIFK